MSGDTQADIAGDVDRQFTCIECGYTIEREVPLLRSSVSDVCVHCSEFAVHVPEHATLEAAGQDAANALAEVGYLTERQAQAYVYRTLLGFTREGTATAMKTSKSNVDNLQRRAGAKITQAERIVAMLRDLCEDE